MIASETLARPTLDVIAAAYAAVVIERQVHLESQVELGEWSADLERCELTLGERTVRVVLLGSSDDRAGTWQWAWDSAAYGPAHPAVQRLSALVDIGREYDVPELATGMIRLSGVYDAGHGPGHTMAFAACGLLAANAYYPAPYEGGTAWLLIDDDRLTPPHLSGTEAVRVIAAATTMFPHHGRLTVETYLGVRGVPASDRGDELIAQLPEGPVSFTFDDLDRMVSVEASL